MKDLFTKEYVDSVLSPFIGKTLRMRTESVDGKFKVPFILETSMESSFVLETNVFGLSFTLKDNFYLKRDLMECMRVSIRKMGITMKVDSIIQELDNESEYTDFTKVIVEDMMDRFKPQIAFTYYTMIESLQVSTNGFVLNGIQFIVCK